MSNHDELSWQDKVLLFFAILLIFILFIIVLLLFCKQRLAKWFPFLVCRIKPDEKTGWHHLNRFGEVKLKPASHSIPEMRARKRGPEDSVEEGSVATNISLQVPVFEEKLNGTVTRKSVHVASSELTAEELLAQQSPSKKKKKHKKKKKKKKHKKKTRTGASANHPNHSGRNSMSNPLPEEQDSELEEGSPVRSLYSNLQPTTRPRHQEDSV